MGAASAWFELDGRATREEVRDAVIARRDAAMRRTTDPYSGDWNTIHGVTFPTDQIFPTFDLARHCCLEAAEKWATAAAARWRTDEGRVRWVVAAWLAE